MKKVHAVTIVSVIFTLLISCWSPLISHQEITQVQDRLSPQLSINYPLDGSLFYNSIIIEGFVKDEAVSGEKGRVLRIDIEIIGTDLKAMTLPDENGTFKAELNAARLDGSITLVVTAIDWNNNRTQKTVSLTKSNFTGFSIEPENKAISVTWKNDPQITQVDLYYSIGGGTPDKASGQVLENIGQDYLFKYLDNEQTKPLKNGQVYGIQLAAHTKTGLLFSPVVEAVPLSPFTLVPQVEADYGEIRLFWRDLEGIEKYKVLRFTEEPGNYDYNDAAKYTDILEVVSTNSFTDNQVTPGQGYYYRIQPVIEKSGISGYAYPSGWAYGKASSIPKLGEVMGETVFEWYVNDLAVRGQYAFIAASNSCFYIVDVSNKSDPRVLGEPISVEGDIWNVVIEGSLLVVCASEGGTHVFDITEPRNPEFLYTLEVTNGLESKSAAFYKNYLAVAEKNRLAVYDCFKSGVDALVDQFQLDRGQASEILWDDSGLYLVCDEEGLLVFDFFESELVLNQEYRNVSLFNNISSLTKDENFLFITRKTAGVSLFDAADPENLSLIKHVDTDGVALDLQVQGNCVFVADKNGGVSVFLFDREQNLLDFIGIAETIDNSMALDIQGEFGYSISDGSELMIFNVLHPAMYRPINLSESLNANDVKIQGNTMFLAHSQEGFSKYDINQLDSPVFISRFELENFDVTRVEYYSDRAVALNSTKAVLCSTDYRDPEDYLQGPGQISFLAMLDLKGSSPVCAAFFSDFLYMGVIKSGSTAVFIYDLSESLSWESNEDLEPVSEITGRAFTDIAIIGDTLFLSDKLNGIGMSSLKDPVDPDFKSEISCFDALNMSFYKNRLFVSDGRFGLKLFDIDPTPELLVADAGITFSKTAAQAGFFYSFSDTDTTGLVCFGFDLQNEFRCFSQLPFSINALAAQDRVLAMALAVPDKELSIYIMDAD